jgi:probable selenium-dependent hydroxylase accessory protein YqeC
MADYRSSRDLSSALGLGPKEVVALVGAGGKTDLMLALAQELAGRGQKVVATTTTKVWKRQAERAPCMILMRSHARWRESFRTGLQGEGHVFLGHEVLDSGKVQGIDRDLAAELSKDPLVDHVIVEADGANGRPLKAPADHEPVIPACTTTVVAVMGVEALGAALKADMVFRPERFQQLTGLKQGDRLTPKAIAPIFRSSSGLYKNSPQSARKVAFLNKVDLLPRDDEARELGRLILEPMASPVARVVVGSVLKGQYAVMGGKPFGSAGREGEP